MVLVIFLIFLLVWLLLFIIPIGFIFSKAGRPGWACIIPIYNTIVMLQVAKMSPWLVLLYLIPIVNVILSIIVMVKLSTAFKHGVGFALGLIFLPIIFMPILGYGNSEYDFDE